MNNNTLHCEPVQLKLVGLDGNAWSLMGAFSQAAKKQGRSKEEIKAVMDDCMSSDYNHLLSVLTIHTK
jgi:predicted CoA-binding protein